MQFDYAATATRPAWPDLPEAVRERIESEIAAPVSHSTTATGGFTPGFAAVLNHQWFVKAAPSTVPWMFRAYTREAEVAAALPITLPIPEFLGAARLSAAGATWLEYPHLNEVFLARMPGFVPALSAAARSELQLLLGGSATALAGDRLLHNDLRPDNILMTERGAVFCDWNYLARGPRWADWVVILAYARFDGLQVTDRLASSALSRGAEPEHIDCWLAVLLAYMLQAGGQAELPDSPALREHQRFSARMFLDWLIERRNLA